MPGDHSKLPDGWEYVGALFEDDIAIPPPREIKGWYCSKCGVFGNLPEPNLPQPDKRYALGRCDCTKPTRRKGGMHVEYVTLVADIHWDQGEFDRRAGEERMRKAYEKELRGTKLKGEEAILAARWRVRVGVVSNRDA